MPTVYSPKFTISAPITKGMVIQRIDDKRFNDKDFTLIITAIGKDKFLAINCGGEECAYSDQHLDEYFVVEFPQTKGDE